MTTLLNRMAASIAEQRSVVHQPLRLTRLAGAEGGSRPEYGVTHITAGYVRRRDNQHSGWRISASALAPAAGMWDRLAVFIDHANLANLFYPSMRDLAAVTFAPVWNPERQSIDGGIRLYNRPDLAWLRMFLDEFLEDQEAGREVPDVGLSAVMYARSESRPVDGLDPDGEQERVTVEIGSVESSDLVFGPGAEGRLREALAMFNRSLFSIPQGGIFMDPKDLGQAPAGPQGDAVAVGQQPAAPQTQPHPLVSEFTQQQAPPQPDPLAATLAALSQQVERLSGDVLRLSTAMGQEEDGRTVHGMGIAPRGPVTQLTGKDHAANVIDWLFGVPDAKLPDPQYRKADMIYQLLTGDWEWRGVFNPDRVVLAGANTTDLPNLAVNAMNKIIQLTYASLRAYRWYEMVAAVAPNDGSTHDMSWIGTGGVGALPTVAEKGAYTELSMADTKETSTFVKKGGYVGITLEMFRKSQIAQIQAVPVGLARSSVMTRSADVATIFTSNSGVGPTLAQDSKALFHADHGNVATTAFGSDSTAWNAADLAIWTQTELGSGKPLAISPKYMLCNRALFRAALVVFGYGDGQPTTYVPEAVDRGPDDPRPWPIAVPDFSDANDWAAIVDPRLYPVINISYAQATSGGQHPLPELYAQTNELTGLVFTNDTLPVKVRDWYAYGVNGYRGIAKRNVA